MMGGTGGRYLVQSDLLHYRLIINSQGEKKRVLGMMGKMSDDFRF